MDFYYTDTALECWQAIQEDIRTLEYSKIDALAYRKNEANLRLNDEIASMVQRYRSLWGDRYIHLLGPWKEQSSIGDWHEWRRCVMAYELPKAAQRKMLSVESRHSIRLPHQGDTATLDLRPMRGIRDPRAFGGAEFMDVLYLVARD